MEEAITSNALKNAINQNRTGEGIYIKSLLQMYQNLMHSYQPMHITMLLNAIRQYQKGKWSTIDMKTEYFLSDIIHLLMSEWNEDTSKEDQSPLKDIFGIEIIRERTCLKCYNRVRQMEHCWQYKIPITMHCFRYWTIEDDTVTGTFMFITPEQLVLKDTVDKMFPLVVGDIETLDDDEMTTVEVHNQHYITINGKIEYAVFVSCLTRCRQMCAWTAYDWFEKIEQTSKYNTQFKYTLVFQKVTNAQQITDFHYYDIQQYQVTGTQTYFPKTYPRMKWLVAKKEVSPQTTTIQNITEEIKSKIHAPAGDSLMALAEQLSWTNKNGYLQYLNCTKCNKTQPMMIQSQITKFNKIIMLHLIQYPTQYYELEWNPDAHIHGWPIKKQNHTINVSINGYITAQRKNNIIKYATHWRSKPKNKKQATQPHWHALSNSKYTSTSKGTSSKHACLFFGFRFDNNE